MGVVVEHDAHAGVTLERRHSAAIPSAATPAAVFGRVGWLFGDGAVHFLAGAIVGGGNIRHAIVFNADKTCGPTATVECVDTIASGPFLFGPSLGMLVELGSTFNLVLAINTQFGLPKETLNVDVNGGIAIRL